MHYRYYIGLDLPTDVSAQIQTVQAQLFDPAIALRPLEPHITLLPPPAVEYIEPSALARSIRAAVKPLLPLTVTLEGIKTFDRYAVVINVRSPEIHTLRKQLTKLLPPELKGIYAPFHPHVTLNQALRGKQLPQRLADQYRKQLAAQLPMTCTIDHITLYRWLRPRTYEAERI